MSSRELTSGEASGDRVAHILLGVGALAVVVALSFLATAISGSAGKGAGEGGGDGALGGRPVTSAQAPVTARFALSVSESGRPGPPVVVISAEEPQVCSVLLGSGAEGFALADVEWSRAGVVLDGGVTPVVVSTSSSSASSCYRPSGPLDVGVHSVRWSAGDSELIDAVVVGDAVSTGLVEIVNSTDGSVCTVRISPGEVATSSNDLVGVLDENRRTRLAVSTGPHRFEAESCAGELVGSGQIDVVSRITLIILGDPVVPIQEDIEPIDPGSDQSDGSAAPELEPGPFAFGAVWTSLASDVGVPQDRLAFVGPENEANFCLTWEYRNVPAGSAFELVWSVDGVTGPGDVSSGTTSPPVDGNFWGCYGNPNGLPDGRYEAEWRIDGATVFSESITVGPAQTTELRLRNDSGIEVCRSFVGLPGSASLGLNRLDGYLAPDATTNVTVATGVVDIQVEACNGSRLLDVAALSVGPDGVDVVIGPRPFAFGAVWTSLASDVGVPQDRLAFVGPENEANFCLTWEYRNVPAGSAFELVWSVDGVTGPGDVSSGTTSPPVDGNFWGCYGNPNGLPDGRYEAEWRIDGATVFSESITVGRAEESFVEVVNQSTVPVCAVYLSAAGSSTNGLNELGEELGVGASVRLEVGTGTHDLVVERCDGRLAWVGTDVVVSSDGGVVAVAG